MNATTLLSTAAKYAGRDDDRMLDGIEAHPNADGAIARLNDDVGGRLAGACPVQAVIDLQAAHAICEWDGGI